MTSNCQISGVKQVLKTWPWLQVCTSAQGEQGGSPAVHAASNPWALQMCREIWVRRSLYHLHCQMLCDYLAVECPESGHGNLSLKDESQRSDASDGPCARTERVCCHVSTAGLDT